ncbi:histone-lysine N-methyltransferase PRDM9 [Trichonephila clavipes]|nr:histone-lysine N-methyltransferase PRDM9 [Trichonephila clavipes]
MPLTSGMVFGPYKGSLIKRTVEAKKSGYAWPVRKGLKVSHYVEGRDEGSSNWMRYVNCTDREERHNVVAFQYQGDIYYRTYKLVLPFTEILVWYGDGYASDLGIDLQQEKELECPRLTLGNSTPSTERVCWFQIRLTLRTKVSLSSMSGTQPVPDLSNTDFVDLALSFVFRGSNLIRDPSIFSLFTGGASQPLSLKINSYRCEGLYNSTFQNRNPHN